MASLSCKPSVDFVCSSSRLTSSTGLPKLRVRASRGAFDLKRCPPIIAAKGKVDSSRNPLSPSRRHHKSQETQKDPWSSQGLSPGSARRNEFTPQFYASLEQRQHQEHLYYKAWKAKKTDSDGAVCDFSEVAEVHSPLLSRELATPDVSGSSSGVQEELRGTVGSLKLVDEAAEGGVGLTETGPKGGVRVEGDADHEDEEDDDDSSDEDRKKRGGKNAAARGGKDEKKKRHEGGEKGTNGVAPAVMPAEPQEGLRADLAGHDLHTMVHADYVYNKELNWLSFNWRVLYMALDARTPLLERLRFLAISAGNLDEFFSKRVGALKRQEAAGVENLIGKDDQAWTPTQQLKLVAKEVRRMVQTQLWSLQMEVLPALRKENIQLLQWEELNDGQKDDLRRYFKESLEPILTPLAVDPGHPFPFIGNMTLSIAVELRDPLDGDLEFAIVNVPSGCERWRSLAFDDDDEHLKNSFISVEQIIKANLDSLFGGMEIVAAHFFRVSRNADVARDEETAEDLLEMITDEMRERKWAPFVRLEVDCDMPEELLQKLTPELSLTHKDDVYHICGPLAMGDFMSLPVKLGMQTELEFSPWVPKTHPRLQGEADIFAVIRSGDLLVHHPYHSFGTSTLAFVEAAAADPKVRAIKATLYRTSADSPVITALVKAAEAGKQVSVLVELKARFDEARNVGFAQKLEDTGCNVAYGLVGLKTHCKCTLVVRQEDDGYRTYVHVGTGNYNPRTAAVYTDFGLFTCDKDVGLDGMDLFKYLTGYHRQLAYRKLLVAPGTMRKEFLRLLDREIANAQDGLPARAIIKCNGLDDQVMVAKLYEASNAGVKVDLIVRGMCRVRSGVPGVSENIRVISIIGRFLEHHRIFYFENKGSPQYFIGSADWMTRNLMRRVEVVTPVEDESLKKELRDILGACLDDRTQAWEMQPDGRYRLLGTGGAGGGHHKAPHVGTFADDAGSSKLRGADSLGFQQALMDMVAKQSSKAKKVSQKKKDGSALKLRPRHGAEAMRV